MRSFGRTSRFLSFLLPVRMAAVLAFLLVFVNVVVDPVLIHTFQSYSYPLVAMNWRSFAGSLHAPGDAVEWAGVVLSQSLYFGLPGAAVIVASAWAMLLAGIGVMAAFGKGPVRGTWVMPALTLVLLHCQYEYGLATTLGLTLSLAMANIHVRLPGPWPVRAVLFACMSALAYWTAGGAAFVFVSVAVLHEALIRRRLLAGLACLALAAGVVAALEWRVIHYADWEYARGRLMPFMKYRYLPTIIGVAGLYAYFPLCAAAIALRGPIARVAARLWRVIRGRGGDRTARPRAAVASTAGGAGRGRGFMVAVAQITLLLASATAIGYLSINRQHQLLTRIEMWSSRGQWPEVLKAAKEVPPARYSYLVNVDVNMALCHTGRLGEEMFAWPQRYEILPPLRVADLSSALSRRMADLCLDLGRTNDAEAFAGLYYVPMFLKRLAEVKVVKRQFGAAGVIFNVLSDDPPSAQWAADWRRRLRDDPDASKDADVARWRRVMLPTPKDDLNLVYGRSAGTDERMLLHALDACPANRMAFEYLMGLYLLHGNVAFPEPTAMAVENLRRLDAFKDDQGRPAYPAIPRHYEEAVLLLEGPDGPTFAAIKRRPSEQSVRLHKVFLDKYGPLFRQEQAAVAGIDGMNLPEEEKVKLRAAARADTRAKAAPVLRGELAGTYFLYFACGPEGSP